MPATLKITMRVEGLVHIRCLNVQINEWWRGRGFFFFVFQTKALKRREISVFLKVTQLTKFKPDLSDSKVYAFNM